MLVENGLINRLEKTDFALGFLKRFTASGFIKPLARAVRADSLLNLSAPPVCADRLRERVPQPGVGIRFLHRNGQFYPRKIAARFGHGGRLRSRVSQPGCGNRMRIPFAPSVRAIRFRKQIEIAPHPWADLPPFHIGPISKIRPIACMTACDLALVIRANLTERSNDAPVACPQPTRQAWVPPLLHPGKTPGPSFFSFYCRQESTQECVVPQAWRTSPRDRLGSHAYRKVGPGVTPRRA